MPKLTPEVMFERILAKDPAGKPVEIHERILPVIKMKMPAIKSERRRPSSPVGFGSNGSGNKLGCMGLFIWK